MKSIKLIISTLGLFCLLLVLMAANLSAQTIKIKKYLPIEKANRYSYKGTFKEREYQTELIVEIHQRPQGEELYYFVNRLESSTIVGTNIFGLGSLLMRKDGIYSLETFWNTDLVKTDSLEPQLMIPRKFKLSDDISLPLDKGAAQLLVNFMYLETVQVPAGEFKDCLKIHIRTEWEKGNTYNEFVWLAKGVGVVKWQRTTGRVDELVSYHF